MGPVQFTNLAGTPTAVQCAGTDFNTTELAPTREYSPISILPKTLAPIDRRTPRRNLRMAVALLFSRAAQSHAVQHRNVVFHHRGLADHHAGAVVDHDTSAKDRGRMDVDIEQFGNAALEEQRHAMAVLPPKPMGDAITFQRVEPLVEQECFCVGMTGWITLEHRRKIRSHRLPDPGIGDDGLFENLAGEHRTDILAAHLLGEMIG